MMTRQQRMAQAINALAEKRRAQLDLQDAAYMTVPYAYCTMCMALKEMTDLTTEDIGEIVMRSYHLWNNWEYDLRDPLDVCAELTGVMLPRDINRDEGYQE